MAATEPIDIVELGVGDAQAGLVLSTEAGWNQNEADWRFFLSKGIVFGLRDGDQIGRNRRAAALLGEQCLDQHGAGDAETGAAAALPPSSSMPASLWRHGAASRPGWTRRPLAPPSTVRSASPRCCNCGGCGWRSRRKQATRQPLSAGGLEALIARDTSAMGFDRSTLLSEFGSRPGSRIVSDTRLHRPRSGRPHRATHRPAAR